MTHSAKLLKWISTGFGLIILASIILYLCMRYKHIAFIDHLFDFHINEEAVREECEKRSNHSLDGWFHDSKSDRDSHDRGDDYGRDVGTTGPPDRDA